MVTGTFYFLSNDPVSVDIPADGLSPPTVDQWRRRLYRELYRRAFGEDDENKMPFDPLSVDRIANPALFRGWGGKLLNPSLCVPIHPDSSGRRRPYNDKKRRGYADAEDFYGKDVDGWTDWLELQKPKDKEGAVIVPSHRWLELILFESQGGDVMPLEGDERPEATEFSVVILQPPARIPLPGTISQLHPVNDRAKILRFLEANAHTSFVEFRGVAQLLHNNPACAENGSIVKLALEFGNARLADVPARLRENRKIAQMGLISYGRHLRFLSPAFRGDRELVKLACRQNWLAWQFATDAAQSDKQLLLEVIQKFPESGALEYDTRAELFWPVISSELQADRDVIAAMVGRDRGLFQHIGEGFRVDKDVVRAAIEAKDSSSEKEYGHYKLKMVLELTSADMRNNREIMQLALKTCGTFLEYASVELRADRELVLMAMAQDVCALGGITIVRAGQQEFGFGHHVDDIVFGKLFCI